MIDDSSAWHILKIWLFLNYTNKKSIYNLNFAAFKHFKIFTILHENLVSPGLLLW